MGVLNFALVVFCFLFFFIGGRAVALQVCRDVKKGEKRAVCQRCEREGSVDGEHTGRKRKIVWCNEVGNLFGSWVPRVS